MNLKEKAKRIRDMIPQLYLALKAKDTPWYAKALAFLTVSYALSPIDLIPDFIPILGYLDDLIILPLMIALTIKCIPQEIMARSKAEAQDLWQDGRPKVWWVAILIIVFWLGLIGLILFLIFR